MSYFGAMSSNSTNASFTLPLSPVPSGRVFFVKGLHNTHHSSLYIYTGSATRDQFGHV